MWFPGKMPLPFLSPFFAKRVMIFLAIFSLLLFSLSGSAKPGDEPRQGNQLEIIIFTYSGLKSDCLNYLVVEKKNICEDQKAFLTKIIAELKQAINVRSKIPNLDISESEGRYIKDCNIRNSGRNPAALVVEILLVNPTKCDTPGEKFMVVLRVPFNPLSPKNQFSFEHTDYEEFMVPADFHISSPNENHKNQRKKQIDEFIKGLHFNRPELFGYKTIFVNCFNDNIMDEEALSTGEKTIIQTGLVGEIQDSKYAERFEAEITRKESETIKIEFLENEFSCVKTQKDGKNFSFKAEEEFPHYSVTSVFGTNDGKLALEITLTWNYSLISTKKKIPHTPFEFNETNYSDFKIKTKIQKQFLEYICKEWDANSNEEVSCDFNESGAEQ